MPDFISIHNSRKELAVSEERLRTLGFEQKIFHGGEGKLPYCQYVRGADRPGNPSLLMFLHGVGSVGTDNWKQMRIPGPPLIEYVRSHQEKAVLLFPQCAENFFWVNVPWSDLSHEMPEKPSKFMSLTLELLDAKIAEFVPDPERIYAGGISMGGYGAWDLVSRRPELFAAVLPICGGADVRQAPKLKNLAVYMLHGDQDGAVPVSRSRDMKKALEDAGNTKVVYREIPGLGHNAWDPAFEDDQAMEWLYSRKRG